MNQIKVGAFISQRRKAKGWTQSQLAEKLEITDKAISKWETGKGFPDISLIEPLAAALGVSIPELLTGEQIINTNRSAKQLQPEIEKEKNQTKELIEWFLSQWRPEDIDREIEDHDSLPQEELSLKRFQIIQDHLITNKDLPDPAYVDALSEEIYSQLYES